MKCIRAFSCHAALLIWFHSLMEALPHFSLLYYLSWPHLGEKPYECSNCKKRFSHSGSYSSHISSKKCISVISVNGRPRLASAKSVAQSPLPLPLLPTSPSSPSKPLQEQLPLTQIKSEPVDYEYKPTVLTSPPTGLFCGGAAAPLQGTVQAVVLPTVGLVSPISINLADLQSALKVAVDNNVIRQVLENSNKVPGQVGPAVTTGTLHTSQQQLISAISLPIVGQDGSAKIIINYSLDSNQGQLMAQNLKKEPESNSPAQTTTDSFKCQKLPGDLTVMDPRPGQAINKEEKNIKTCLLCDNCPGGLEVLHTLKHCMTDTLRLNGASLEKSESAVDALLTEGGPCSQSKNLLSLLKAYFALKREPTSEELAKISDSVSLPMHVVKRLFNKMQEGQISPGETVLPSKEEDDCEAVHVVSLVPGKDFSSPCPTGSQDSPTEATLAEGSDSHSPAASPTPLNLKAVGPDPAPSPRNSEGPLDLSLPKLAREEGDRLRAKACIYSNLTPSCTGEDQPLNLTCTKKEASQLVGTGTSPTAGYASQTNAKPLDMMSTIQCLTALATNTKQNILIPQLAYTYTTKENSPAGTQMQETIHLNGLKVRSLSCPVMFSGNFAFSIYFFLISFFSFNLRLTRQDKKCDFFFI